MAEKQYGLILPSKGKKSKGSTPPRKNIFEDESDDEDAPVFKKAATGNAKVQKNASIQQKQSKEVIRKALADDPTVYQYDEVYDAMEEKKSSSREMMQRAEKKSKYIETLMSAAEKRKQENEQRIERQVQREREAEGDEFKDKEEFVTTAYRKKMEEQQEQMEEAKRKEMIDDMTDVTKQKDLSGFYRHLYRTQTEAPKSSEEAGPSVKIEKEEKADSDGEKPLSPEKSPEVPEALSPKGREDRRESKERSLSRDRRSRSRDRSLSKERRSRSRSRERRRHHHHRDRDREKHRNRGHRKHHGSSRSRSRERDRRHKEKRHERERSPERDRSRERHRDRPKERRPRSREDQRERRKEEKSHSKKHREEPEPRHDENRERKESSRKKKTKEGSVPPSPPPALVSSTELTKEEIESKRKKIWEKRTVGSVFEDAFIRYLERKQSNPPRPAIVSANN